MAQQADSLGWCHTKAYSAGSKEFFMAVLFVCVCACFLFTFRGFEFRKSQRVFQSLLGSREQLSGSGGKPTANLENSVLKEGIFKYRLLQGLANLASEKEEKRSTAFSVNPRKQRRACERKLSFWHDFIRRETVFSSVWWSMEEEAKGRKKKWKGRQTVRGYTNNGLAVT